MSDYRACSIEKCWHLLKLHHYYYLVFNEESSNISNIL